MKELKNRGIPYKIYLSEDEMPLVLVQCARRHEDEARPLLNPGTLKPMTAEEMGHVFCAELVKQEMDDHTLISPSPRTCGTSIRCIVPPRWCAPIVWRRSWAPRHISTTNSRATTPPAVTS